MNISKEDLSNSQVWSLYWASGERNSCVASQSVSDQKELNDYWHNLAHGLPENGRVLDMACGNGAVAYCLNSIRSDINIDAIDKSELNPLTIDGEKQEINAGESNLNFHANTNILNLPKNFKEVDLICSQFGIEYAGLLEVPSAIKGRLKDNGELAFIIHNKEGDLYASTITKLNEYNTLREYKLLDLLDSYLSYTFDDNTVKRTESYQDLEVAGQQYMDLDIGTKVISGSVFDAISQILALTDKDSLQAKKAFELFSLRFNAEENRLAQMVSVAQNEDQMRQFDSLIEQQGFVDRNINEFYIGQARNKYLLAWEYRARLKN